ncbi:MAG: hypothetical protein J0L67_18130 [Cytophagales bacterium]|nr:hypothetical protein [Cytophagales bacterium]
MQSVKVKILILVISALNNNVRAQGKDVIIEKYIAAVGGVEKWKTLQSVVLSMTQYPKEERVIKIPSIHNNQVNDRWISISKDGDSSTVCFNGKNYWRQVKGGAPESFDFYAPVYVKYARLGEPTHILNADSIKLEGTVDFIAGDKKVMCYKMALFVDGSRYYYFINTITYYLEGYTRGDPGDPVTSFNDYKKINELLVPFEEIIYRGKNIESRFVTNLIYFNRNVPSQTYDYPKGTTNIISTNLLFNLIQQ